MPIFYNSKKFEQRFASKHKKYEIWTTGVFDDDALSYLKDRQEKIKKYEICWRDGKYVLDQAKKLETKTVYKTLKIYYVDHTIDKKLGLQNSQAIT